MAVDSSYLFDSSSALLALSANSLGLLEQYCGARKWLLKHSIFIRFALVDLEAVTVAASSFWIWSLWLQSQLDFCLVRQDYF